MELIDKKAALKALYLAGELINKYGGRFYEGKFYGCQSAYEIIKDMPTVEERKQGRSDKKGDTNVINNREQV